MPPSFIDGEFVETQADLLFRVEIAGRDARLYVVFEHKSDAKARALVQVGGYVMDVLDQYFEQGGKLPAPVVIPVILHHSETGWTVARSFHELFDEGLLQIPGVREHVPSFQVVLDDISDATDDELRARAVGAAAHVVPLALWALRDARRGPRLLMTLAAWADVIAQIAHSPTGQDALFAVLRYLSVVNEAITTTELNQALVGAPPETREALMTLAEQWMAEGEARGEARGRAEGRAEGIRRTLESLVQLKFGDEVDEAVKVRLANADEAQLSAWTQRVLSAKNLADIFR